MELRYCFQARAKPFYLTRGLLEWGLKYITKRGEKKVSERCKIYLLLKKGLVRDYGLIKIYSNWRKPCINRSGRSKRSTPSPKRAPQ